MQLASKVDTIVIMSGDSDYIELVRHLKSEGVRVEIASVDATTSNIIKEECDHHYRINEDDWFTYAPKQSSQNNGKPTNKRRSSKKSSVASGQKQTADNDKQPALDDDKQPKSNQSDILASITEPSQKYEPEYPQSQYLEN